MAHEADKLRNATGKLQALHSAQQQILSQLQVENSSQQSDGQRFGEDGQAHRRRTSQLQRKLQAISQKIHRESDRIRAMTHSQTNGAIKDTVEQAVGKYLAATMAVAASAAADQSVIPNGRSAEGNRGPPSLSPTTDNVLQSLGDLDHELLDGSSGKPHSVIGSALTNDEEFSQMLSSHRHRDSEAFVIRSVSIDSLTAVRSLLLLIEDRALCFRTLHFQRCVIGLSAQLLGQAKALLGEMLSAGPSRVTKLILAGCTLNTEGAEWVSAFMMNPGIKLQEFVAESNMWTFAADNIIFLTIKGVPNVRVRRNEITDRPGVKAKDILYYDAAENKNQEFYGLGPSFQTALNEHMSQVIESLKSAGIFSPFEEIKGSINQQPAPWLSEASEERVAKADEDITHRRDALPVEDLSTKNEMELTERRASPPPELLGRHHGWDPVPFPPTSHPFAPGPSPSAPSLSFPVHDHRSGQHSFNQFGGPLPPRPHFFPPRGSPGTQSPMFSSPYFSNWSPYGPIFPNQDGQYYSGMRPASQHPSPPLQPDGSAGGVWSEHRNELKKSHSKKSKHKKKPKKKSKSKSESEISLSEQSDGVSSIPSEASSMPDMETFLSGNSSDSDSSVLEDYVRSNSATSGQLAVKEESERWYLVKPSEWTIAQVQSWLDWLGFSTRVQKTFKVQEVDGSVLVDAIDDQLLRKHFGVSKTYIRRSLICALKLATNESEVQTWHIDGEFANLKHWSMSQVHDYISAEVNPLMAKKFTEHRVTGAYLEDLTQQELDQFLPTKILPKKRALRLLSRVCPSAAQLFNQGNGSATSKALERKSQSLSRSTVVGYSDGRPSREGGVRRKSFSKTLGGEFGLVESSSAPSMAPVPAIPQLGEEVNGGVNSPNIPVVEVDLSEFGSRRNDLAVANIVSAADSSSASTSTTQIEGGSISTLHRSQSSDSQKDVLLVSRYKVLLGSQGYHGKSTVLDAVDTWTRRGDAVKLKFLDESLKGKADHEIAVLDDVGSEHCVEVLHDLVEGISYNGRNVVCIVLESGGEDLSTMLKHNAFTINDIKSVMEKVAKCLHALHQKLYIHGDFKLEHVVDFSRTRTLNPKLIDMEDATRFGNLMSMHATTEYCPPEMAAYILGQQLEPVTADSSFDVWCFGMALLRMFDSGHPIPEFAGKNKQEILTAVSSEGFRVNLARVPDRGARQLLELCLAIDPTKRPTMRTILKHPFFIGYSTTIHEKLAKNEAANQSVDRIQSIIADELAQQNSFFQTNIHEHSERILHSLEKQVGSAETSTFPDFVRSFFALYGLNFPVFWIAVPHLSINESNRLSEWTEQSVERFDLLFLCQGGDISIGCKQPHVYVKLFGNLVTGVLKDCIINLRFTALLVKLTLLCGTNATGLILPDALPFLGELSTSTAIERINQLLELYERRSEAQTAELNSNSRAGFGDSMLQDLLVRVTKSQNLKPETIWDAIKTTESIMQIWKFLIQDQAMLKMKAFLSTVRFREHDTSLRRVLVRPELGGGVTWVCEKHAQDVLRYQPSIDNKEIVNN